MIIEVVTVTTEAKSVLTLIEETRNSKLRTPIPPVRSITFRLVGDAGKVFARAAGTVNNAPLIDADATTPQLFASLDNANLNGISLLTDAGTKQVAIFATY